MKKNIDEIMEIIKDVDMTEGVFLQEVECIADFGMATDAKFQESPFFIISDLIKLRQIASAIKRLTADAADLTPEQLLDMEKLIQILTNPDHPEYNNLLNFLSKEKKVSDVSA